MFPPFKELMLKKLKTCYILTFRPPNVLYQWHIQGVEFAPKIKNLLSEVSFVPKKDTDHQSLLS